MQERGIDVCKLGDLPHSHTVDSMLGEQFLRGVENAFTRRETSLRAPGRLVVQECSTQRPMAFSRAALFVSALGDWRGCAVNTHAAHQRRVQGRCLIYIIW